MQGLDAKDEWGGDVPGESTVSRFHSPTSDVTKQIRWRFGS